MIYVTSDNHFYHKNIIEYCNRPYSSVHHMNEAMIENWNNVVSPLDEVYNLGDFALGKVKQISDVVTRLNGFKTLVLGNHDRSLREMVEAGFDNVVDEAYLQVGDYSIWMHHVPYGPQAPRDNQRGIHGRPIPDTQWVRAYNRLILCGHVHTSWKSNELGNINVGVDQWNYTPVSINEIIEYAQINGIFATI